MTYSVTGSGASDLGYLKLPRIEQLRYDSAYGPIPGHLVRPDRDRTCGLNGQMNVLPNPNIRVTFQSSLYTQDQQQSTLQGAIPQLEGEYISPASLVGRSLIVDDYETQTDHAVTTMNSGSLHWQIRPWLPLEVTGGVQTIQRTDQDYLPFGVSPGGVYCVPSPTNPCGDTAGFLVSAGDSLNRKPSPSISPRFHSPVLIWL